VGIEYTNRKKRNKRKTGYRSAGGGPKAPKPAPKMKKLLAKYPGWCSICETGISVGEWISRWGSHWNHTECCEKTLISDRDEARDKKSHKANTYRRGKSPGSYG